MNISSLRNEGFTLIELMVTLAIAAILVTVGLPAMTNMVTKSKLSGQVQEFFGAVGFARSEAIKRGASVSICKSNNASSCGGNWSDGWIVFIDSDANGSRNTAVGTTESILRVFPAISAGYTLNVTADLANAVTYDRLGMGSSSAGRIVFCKDSDETKAKVVFLTKARPRISTGASGIGSCEAP